MAHTHRYRPADHRSRREIDMAIGVLMGIRRCSQKEALDTLVRATRASGVGIGGVSRTLLDVVSEGPEPSTDDAIAHWNALLELPSR
ncbi:MAG: ANTAR domain-containing protein [Actinomycetota bacterium]|uniref:ANTAR domain-containing protein n=1 Tax=Mycobacterium lentiflavum TaxID=141349 RepID=A0ABY3UX11_MYCLN|nr:ANTAR domain-containing protein [Mycobacterium lentiflavum]MEE3062647.1 ANTAR domain-containing protein [Actinomycetota bacterium]ULP41520.1 ANTAR domain-containing protein [Mycobacterium lentiflavum]